MTPTSTNDGRPDAAEPSFASSFDPVMLDQLLRNQGIHPDDVLTLLRYAPLALTHLCWRNSILEDWHAGPDPRISDAEMMRANVATTRLFHQALWSAFQEPWADGMLMCRDNLTSEDVNSLAVCLADALEDGFSADRPLPHGVTLGELGAGQIQDLYDHAETQCGALIGQAEEHGVAVVLMWLGLRGRLSCGDWWGSPRWPAIVDRFLVRLDDAEDPFWTLRGHPGNPPVPPADTLWLRRMLLGAPDSVDTEIIDFCLHDAGLGFVRLDE